MGLQIEKGDQPGKNPLYNQVDCPPGKTTCPATIVIKKPYLVCDDALVRSILTGSNLVNRRDSF